MTDIEHSYEFTIKTIGGEEENIQVNRLSTRILLRLGVGINSGKIELNLDIFEQLIDAAVPELLDRVGSKAINFSSIFDLTFKILEMDAGLDREELEAKKAEAMAKAQGGEKIEN